MENSKDLDYEGFINNPVITRAFLRSLEVIGEAVKNIPRNFRNKYPGIPWKEIAGMRDKLIHEYFGVNYGIVWKTVKKEIPKLENQIREIMEKEGWSHEL